jgi:hypothetical protein
MSSFNINLKNTLQTQGLSTLEKNQQDIAKTLNAGGELSQLDYLNLQQKMQAYTTTISMMSTMMKSLTDSDKEVIRNSEAFRSCRRKERRRQWLLRKRTGAFWPASRFSSPGTASFPRRRRFLTASPRPRLKRTAPSWDRHSA